MIPLAAAWEILEGAAWRQGYGVKGSGPGQIKGWRSGRCRDEKCSGDKMKEIGAQFDLRERRKKMEASRYLPGFWLG